MKLGRATGYLSQLDREHNDAWIGTLGTTNLGLVETAIPIFKVKPVDIHIYITECCRW